VFFLLLSLGSLFFFCFFWSPMAEAGPLNSRSCTRTAQALPWAPCVALLAPMPLSCPPVPPLPPRSPCWPTNAMG